MYRIGNPSTLTVGIRATTGLHPSGSDLTSGTIDANTFTTGAGGLWYEILMTEYTLTPNTRYAIVCRANVGGANYVKWRTDNSAPAYTLGNREDSADSGGSWTTHIDLDSMFEVWGSASGSSSAFNKLMDTCRRVFHGASFDVTRSALTLGTTRDSVTGWYPKTYTDTTTHMVIIQKESQKLASDLGYWVSLDALGFTVDGAEVYDLVTDSFGRTWIVEVVKPIIVGDIVQFFVCDLKELSVYGG